MHTLSLPLISYRTFITDALILSAVYFVPALAHVVPFPVHLFEPMRVLLVVGLLVARNNLNTCLLALTIPLVSTVVAGHPPLVKAIIMSAELLANVVILTWLSQRYRWNDGLAFLVSTLISKAVYYALKFLFLKLGWIEGSLISTPLINQLIVVSILAVIYELVFWLIRTKQK